MIGGGAQLTDDGGIEFADFEIELREDGQALEWIAHVLEEAGAPRGGSQLLDGQKGLRDFGNLECLAIVLDGVSLPDETYDALDFDEVVAQIAERAGTDSYRGFWQGDEETGLFFYATSAENVFARIEPLLRELPIAQNARVVIGHGKAGLPARTTRLPRH